MRTPIRSVAVGVVPSLLLGLHAYATPFLVAQRGRENPPETQPFANLRLTLSTRAAEYRIGEPIAVYAELANPRDLPALAHRAFGWRPRGATEVGHGYPAHLVLTLYRDGTPDQYRPYGMAHVDRASPARALIAGHGNLRTKELIVGFDDHASSVTSPGSVELLAEFHDTAEYNDVIRSNRVRIAIARPRGRDADAYESLRQQDLLPKLGYLYFLRPVKDDQIRVLTEFLEKYADTVYAPYASFGLGQMYFYRERYAEAIETLKRLAEKHPKSSVAEDALYIVAESYRRQKNLPKAEKWFREVIKRYPDTPAADDADAELQKIAREPTMLFRGDRRLDVATTLDLPPATLIEDAFQSVSRSTGVPLHAAPEIRQTLVWPRQWRKLTLREFMAKFDRSDDRRWFPEPDGGYRLVSIKAPEPPKPKRK